MVQIRVNDGSTFTIEHNQETSTINGRKVDLELKRLPNGEHHILVDGKSATAIVTEIDRKEKTISLNVDGRSFRLAVKEPIDLVLENMGLNFASKKKAESIKAPMPGLVLKLFVEEGQSIRKGDPILVLEAMKMENVFKAPADSTVKSILVKEGQAVEKGVVLIELS